MDFKKFDEQQKQQIKVAKKGLEIIEEVKKLEEKSPLKDSSEMKDINKKKEQLETILENPEEAVKKRIENLAYTVAQIKEVGLNSSDPVVMKWAEQELGANATELDQILNYNSTPEEVRREVLERMHAPKESFDFTKQGNMVFKRK